MSFSLVAVTFLNRLTSTFEESIMPSPANSLPVRPTGDEKGVPGISESDASRDAHRHRPRRLSRRDVDDTTLFYNQNKDAVGAITPEDEAKLLRKNFWCLLSQTWWIAFLIHLDKSTLAQASIMGIFRDVDMSKNEFNKLFVVFYAGYLIALWPGAVLSQRIGHKHFITCSLLLWSLLLGMHPLVKTGGQLTAVRFLLGMVRPVSISVIHTILTYITTRPNLKSCLRQPFSTKHFSHPRRAHGSNLSGGPLGVSRTSSFRWFRINLFRTTTQELWSAI